MVEMLSPCADNAVISSKNLFTECVEVIIDAFEIFGFDRSGYSPKRTVDHWYNLLLSSPAGTSWMDIVKYKIAAFFSAWANQPLPKAPFMAPDKADCILTGLGYRWIRSYLRSVDRHEFWCVLSTVLYSKKGFPRPGAELVDKAVEKTIGFLTSSHYTPETSLDRIELLDTWEERAAHRELVGDRKIKHSNGYMLYRHEIHDQLRRTVRELFSPDDPEIDLTKPRFPSTSANYNRSRSGLGAFVEVANVARTFFPEWIGATKMKWEGRKHARVPDRRVDFFPTEGFLPPHRRRFVSEPAEHPLVKKRRLTEIPSTLSPDSCFLFKCENPEFPYGSYSRKITLDEEMESHDADVWVADATTLDERVRQVYQKVYECALLEPKLVEAVGLAEALKVRVISKGPPLTYAALQPVQKATHAALAKHRCFSLIGNGGTSEGYLLERLGTQLRDDEAYLSGDYKSSTDMIDPEFSETVVDEICKIWNFSPELTRLYLSSLTGHSFVVKISRSSVPDFLSHFHGEEHQMMVHLLEHAVWVKDVAEIELPQAWGQLMGSITSFPILCIINACICRMALEFSVSQSITLEDARLMINGDDCLFRINRFGKRYWEQLGAYVGLQPSVGKTYYSREYMNINSTSFYISDVVHKIKCPDLRSNDPNHNFFEREGRIVEVPFVNLGLLNGLTRSGTLDAKPKDESEHSKSIGAKAHELLRGHAPERQVKVFKKFLNHNWKKLNEVHVPWYMPEWIGGLGLPWVGRKVGDASLVDVDEYAARVSYEFGPTELDRLKANTILLNWSTKHPTKVPPVAIWQIHEYVMGRLPEKPKVSLLPSSSEKDYQLLYASLARETLFSEFLDFVTEADSASTDPAVHTLRKNERIWSKASPLRPAIPLDSLIPRETYDHFPVIYVN